MSKLISILTLVVMMLLSVPSAYACGTITAVFTGFNLNWAPTLGNIVWFLCSDGTTYAAVAGYNGANESSIQNMLAHADTAKALQCQVGISGGVDWGLLGVTCQ